MLDRWKAKILLEASANNVSVVLCHPGSTSCCLGVPQETQAHKMEGQECDRRSSGGGDSTLVVLSLNEVLKLNWLRKWLMCIMELRVALHKGVC